jgi:hypothetical protein
MKKVTSVFCVQKKHGDELSRIMGDMHFDASNQSKEDDLLDLMDSVQ